MRIFSFFCVVILVTTSCQNNLQEQVEDINSSETLSQAQQIIQAAIEKHGGSHYEKNLTTFRFRGRNYEAARRGGKFEYKRIFNDSLGRYVEDVLNNDGFYRKIEGAKTDLKPEKSKAYANSVNSVIYFAHLPYFLEDPAVKSDYLGAETIKDQPYHKVKITFKQEGGGKDFEDEFVYWFHQDSMTLDYLAYNYLTDGGGARFRSAYNIRKVEGIRFADFINFKPQTKRRDVEAFGKLYEKGELVELSKIETENIQSYSVKIGRSKIKF